MGNLFLHLRIVDALYMKSFRCSGIPQFLVERVEIVKGPISTLYGSEAIGGVINLITKLPENTATLNVESFVTGWGEVNTDIGFKYRLSNNSSGLLGINYFNYAKNK